MLQQISIIQELISPTCYRKMILHVATMIPRLQQRSCKLTTGTPPGSTLCLSRSQFSDLQKPVVWVLSGSNLQTFFYDPGISHTSLASHARGLLLSLHFLEKDLHLKHTLWCDWRITTHIKKYKTSLYIDWLMKMLWPEAHRSLTLYFP